MRGHITLTAAAPGVGKSTLAVEEAVSLVTGEDFLNLDITEKRKVGLINNEETRDEIERRIEATCQAFKIQFTDIADRLFIHSGVDDEKFVISRDVGGEIVHTPYKQMLREFVGDRVPAAVEWNLFDINIKYRDVEPLKRVLAYPVNLEPFTNS